MTTATSLPRVSDSLECCLTLMRVQAGLARKFDGKLGTFHGVSFGDFAILLALGHAPEGRLRRVDLAAELGLTASAVTRTLIPLEKIGLVKREPDPRDARVGYATLTKSGQRVLTEAMESAEGISKDVVSSGSSTLLATLKRLASDVGV